VKGWKIDDVKAIAALAALALVGLVMVVLGAWWLVNTFVSADVARVWALLATAALPLVAWVAHRLGHVEARGHVAGIDAGVNKVMAAAQDTAALRVNVARVMRQPEGSGRPIVVLPQEPEFRDPPRLQSGVVEL
jgi:hypothetical protein